mgnify:CR=1 FL=1
MEFWADEIVRTMWNYRIIANAEFAPRNRIKKTYHVEKKIAVRTWYTLWLGARQVWDKVGSHCHDEYYWLYTTFDNYPDAYDLMISEKKYDERKKM